MLIFFLLIEAFIGIIAIAYGLITLIMKRVNKEKYLLTLSLTKWMFGGKWGRILHHIFFSIIPILIGVWLLFNVLHVIIA